MPSPSRRVLPWLSTLPLLPLSYAVASLFQAAHDGRAAGNQAFAVAALWGLYGYLLTLIGGPRRTPGRVVQLAGLALILLAFLGNGRWAELAWRWPAYVLTIGAAWALERITNNDGNELSGLNGLAAAWLMFAALRFEVVRLLERGWRHSVGETVSLDVLAAQDRQAWLWTVGLWLLWAGIWWTARKLILHKEDRKA